MNPRLIPEMYELHWDRIMGQQEAQNEAIEAAREQGAEIAAKELVSCAKAVAKSTDDDPDAGMRTRLFIARFCGAIQHAFPELAVELAKGAGMSHLYPGA